MKKNLKPVVLALVIISSMFIIQGIADPVINRKIIVPAHGYSDILFSSANTNIFEVTLSVLFGGNISFYLVDDNNYQLYKNGNSFFAISNYHNISSLNGYYLLNSTGTYHIILDNTKLSIPITVLISGDITDSSATDYINTSTILQSGFYASIKLTPNDNNLIYNVILTVWSSRNITFCIMNETEFQNFSTNSGNTSTLNQCKSVFSLDQSFTFETAKNYYIVLLNPKNSNFTETISIIVSYYTQVTPPDLILGIIIIGVIISLIFTSSLYLRDKLRNRSKDRKDHRKKNLTKTTLDRNSNNNDKTS